MKLIILLGGAVLALQEVKISVQGLLSAAFHPRDLGGGVPKAGRLLEGTRGHQLVRARRGPDYQTEVPVGYSYEWETYRLIVTGRVDGWRETATEIVAEEIKTTYLPLATVELELGSLHEMQLKLYLFFIMAGHSRQQVSGRLTYLNLDDLTEKSFGITITAAEGKALFEQLALPYLTSRREQDQWLRTRDVSLTEWQFPFPDRRAGQDELMETVRQALSAERDLLVEAATGIGKTVAILYPALKSLADGGRFARIFFLTAKTVGKEILKQTLIRAAAQGVRLRTVFIEGRERVCPFGKARCEPTACPYGVDYYAKARFATAELLRQELVTAEVVAEYAQAYQACPFELSLDAALQADLIVADYNYLFDPGVYLRRFFSEGGRDYLFLIDEAHNLVSRGREMYTAELAEADLNRLKGLVPGELRPLQTAIRALEAYFEAWRVELEDEQSRGLRLAQLPDLLLPELQRLVALTGEFLSTNPHFSRREQLLPYFFKLLGTTRIAAGLNRDYAIYVTGPDVGRLKLRMFCLNPGPLLRQRLNEGRLAIFFSATLSPHRYFQELLGSRPDTLYLQLTSPFSQENRLYLHIPEIDTRYRARGQTAVKLARCITDFVSTHIGNYLAFFPSYQYLRTVEPFVRQFGCGARVAVYSQVAGMSDSAKQLFLNSLVRTDTGRSQLGLAVLGGMFGEGVDFPGEALIGVLIVGPGLPMVNEEQELIREYFEERSGDGFFYAYLIPGLIRVIQAAGRVFRRPEDKGAVLLVDDRFGDERYQELLPPDWFMPGRSFSDADYRKTLTAFWEE
jgi:DNA excision repair protein ERCC-2